MAWNKSRYIFTIIRCIITEGFKKLIYFSQEKLNEIIQPPSQKALKAIDCGNKDSVAWWIGRMTVASQGLFTGYLYWITRLMSKVGIDYGETGLRDILSETFQVLAFHILTNLKEGDDKELLKNITGFYNIYMGGIHKIEETSEKFSIHLSPCGLGGRLILEGWYIRDKNSFMIMKNGQSVFCWACNLFHGIYNSMLNKCGMAISSQPSASGSCTIHIEKNKDYNIISVSDNYLQNLKFSNIDKAYQILKTGPMNSISELIKCNEKDWRTTHDFFLLWITLFEGCVYRHYGIQYLEYLVEYTYLPVFNTAYKIFGSLDDINSLNLLSETWHYHQSEFTVHEEDDRFVFKMAPCGSGGRLNSKKICKGNIKYGGTLELINTPSKCTFSQAGFPIYCTHCAISNADQFNGKPRIFIIDGKSTADLNKSCIQYLYKKRAMDKIPVYLLNQVGQSKLTPIAKEYLL